MKTKDLGKKLLNMLKSNWPIKLLSVLLAFIIWSYVMVGTNPVRTKTVKNVPVTIINAAELRSKNLIIDESSSKIPEKVSVVVSAGIDNHKYITADTLKATLNLADISDKGTAVLQLSCNPSMSGASVKGISPSEIEVYVEDLVTKNVPVLAALEGEPNDDYYVGLPELASDYIAITGAKSVVENVAKAMCYVNIEELNTSVRESYPLTLYSNDGEVISSDLLVENMPSAIVDITVLPKKTVAIDEQSVIDAITNVKDDYEVTGVVIDPASIHIAAEQSILDEIELVRIQSINAEGADKNIVLDVQIQPLENVVYQSESIIEVLVKISEIQDSRTYRNRKIEIENLEEGYTAQILSDKYTDITVTGGKSVISGLSADDFVPYIDLAGLSKGTHTCVVEIPQTDGIPVENVVMSVATVKVQIK